NMTPLKCVLLLAAALLASVHFCRADAPNGTVRFSFDAATAPVYDLTGSFGFEQTIIGAGGAEVALTFGIDLTQDVRGLIFGSGETIVNVGNDFVAAGYTVRGRISGGGDNTRV